MTGSIYRFGKGSAEGRFSDLPAIGLRGSYLCEMAALGLSVPPGFVISMDACTRLDKHKPEILEALDWLSSETGLRLGDPTWPLFLAARPSPLKSIPGLLGAVLNIGFNDATALNISRAVPDSRYSYENYCKFIQNYAHIVMGDDTATFDDLTQMLLDERSYVNAGEMRGEDYLDLIARYKAQAESHDGQAFPQDAVTQINLVIAALSRSWNAPRTKAHRKIHGLSDSGIAIVVQAMVFGNRTPTSGTGIVTSRHASNGQAGLFGEFLERAQGPDRIAKLRPSTTIDDWRDKSPEPARELAASAARLEAHLRDAVEIEFTLDNGALHVLDARPAPRTALAALKTSVDMTKAGLITQEEAVLRVDPQSLGQLLHATVDTGAKKEMIASGLPASPGAASGMIVFDIEEAHRLSVQGLKVMLVRTETLPEDIRGLHGAEGVLTSRGGMTSHAAVIARGMGKPCVAGASAIRIDAVNGMLTTPAGVLKRHELITIDGSSGQVFRGEVPTIKPSLSGDFATLLKWSDSFRRMKVRANAETPRDAQAARDFGAEGIGLVRTEHMFFEGDRIIAMREMILADKEDERRAALAKIEPMLQQDFETLFRIMAGLPVTIRLLDPPLHEFLPESPSELEAVAKSLSVAPDILRRRVAELSEKNPMLGHRGVRLLLSFPEITEMQARAVFNAAISVTNETGAPTVPEIMVPLVVAKAELDLIRKRIGTIAAEVEQRFGVEVNYLVGTMIELPRAALRAGEIAQSAEFFSFGTNDLTQTTFGISRDDSASFIGAYTSRGVFARDPFISLDIEGVGELIEIAVDRGRATQPGLALGICGEHGGDPYTISFCERLLLDYVSCSPFRVPIARLAAAQATLRSASNLK